MYLSRLALSQRPDMAALGALLNPAHEGRRQDAHHRLIWAAFATNSDASRDFLWREMGQGGFMVLSARKPAETPLFEHIETQPFDPELQAGDQLAFVLRANATRTVTEGTRKRHRDVVMEALHPIAGAERAARRLEVAQQAGHDWLVGQGARAGFTVEGCHVTAYAVRDLPGRAGKGRPRFGVIDLEGTLRLTDPTMFLARQAQGFGRAKAFGCGLMLIRRA